MCDKTRVRPINKWKVGMLVHNGSLCCKVTSVDGDMVSLYIYNGAWHGAFDTRKNLMHINIMIGDDTPLICPDFLEVIYMTEADKSQWYVNV